MKFEYISFNNFRQYYGRQRAAFSKDPDKNVTVIHGVNGAGKTSFFSAMNWCLYGKKVVEGIGELINKRLINEKGKDETFVMEVELAFSHDGDRYVLKRELEGIKTNEKEFSIETENFTMMKVGYDGQAINQSNPLGIINSILPENVRTYFLFDGEKIDRFARPESKDDVKNAIYNVLKLEILERARKHLGDIAGDYRKELKGFADEQLKDLLEEVEQKRKTKEDKKKRLEEIKAEIQSAENKIKDIDRTLAESKDVRDLQKERELLGKELAEKEEDIKLATSKVKIAATRSFGLIASEMLDRAIEILENKRKKGEIPSKIRQQFLQDLLGRMECICGRHLEKGSQEHSRLLSLLNEGISSKLEEEVIRIAPSLQVIKGDAENKKQTITDAMKERTSLKSQKAELEGRLDDIGRNLRNSPLEDISELEKKRENFDMDIRSYSVEMGSIHTRIIDLDRDLKELEDKIKQVQKEKEEAKLLSTKMSLSQDASDAIDSIYQRFADEMRKQIQVETNEIFKLLIWKESQFTDVHLSNDFKLEVVDRWGTAAELELSAGERQVLSLSFIAAMAKVSGEEAPIVMDTPFGRLSSLHREKITQHIPQLADQMIMFVTDEELRDQTEKNLLPRVGKRYKLAFDQETGCTSIDELT